MIHHPRKIHHRATESAECRAGFQPVGNQYCAPGILMPRDSSVPGVSSWVSSGCRRGRPAPEPQTVRSPVVPVHSEELERLRAKVRRLASRRNRFVAWTYACAALILFVAAIRFGPIPAWVLLILAFAPFIVGETLWSVSTPGRPRCPSCDTDWTHDAFLKWEACKSCGLALPPPSAEATRQHGAEAVTTGESNNVTIRAAVWLRIGQVRAASRCRNGWVQWRRGFVNMDHVVKQHCAELRVIPYDNLSALIDDPTSEPATFLGRRGRLVRFADLRPDDSLRVIVTGFAPMLWWPPGSWMVIDGFSLQRGKEAEPLTIEVLDRYW